MNEVIWCPHCGNDIHKDDIVCPICKRTVDETDFNCDSDYDYDNYDYADIYEEIYGLEAMKT
jgi:predicted amidophosphoribosyltransferase